MYIYIHASLGHFSMADLTLNYWKVLRTMCSMLFVIFGATNGNAY